MIAKGFVLAKDFYPYNARILRDREIPMAGYPLEYVPRWIRERYGVPGVRHGPKRGCTIEPSRTGTSLHSDSREPPPRGGGDWKYLSSTLDRYGEILRKVVGPCHDPRSGVMT